MALLVLKDSEAWVGVVEGEDASMVVVSEWSMETETTLSESFPCFRSFFSSRFVLL